MVVDIEKLPLVSIGIPTYNRASTLVKTIESVLQQTYKNIEIIISDNASADETQSICEQISIDDRRVVYIRQEANVGAANNFTEVLRQSTGDYFMWLGDDDWIDPSYISECTNELVKHPDYSLVAGKPLFYVKANLAYEDIALNLMHEDGRDRLLNYYRYVGENGVFYGLMRRNQVPTIPNTMGGDWLMIAGLAFLGKIKTICNVSVHRESNWSVDYHKKLAKRLNLSEFQGNNPYISIAFAASKDIISNYQIYGKLNFPQRVVLSLKVFKIVLKKNPKPNIKFDFYGFARSCIPRRAYPHLRKIYRYLKGEDCDICSAIRGIFNKNHE